ncbi:hypothetical protein PPERSA_08784 [Pseudocohnilembus persalinus]|uniref:Uncharacterized protein n=1 Tax=Pseudocohnilembus persalinus TaxID=266149 RepID=A0A0V0R7L4_PSEPJ|nr:hypothetical protein PPERSA_08784 [Pseudocohnilembus persalinus]|eukprot:KRX10482.1 hypothetical protein PPERSA_08784 [Pseudocohnilembus persalinus]
MNFQNKGGQNNQSKQYKINNYSSTSIFAILIEDKIQLTKILENQEGIEQSPKNKTYNKKIPQIFQNFKVKVNSFQFFETNSKNLPLIIICTFKKDEKQGDRVYVRRIFYPQSDQSGKNIAVDIDINEEDLEKLIIDTSKNQRQLESHIIYKLIANKKLDILLQNNKFKETYAEIQKKLEEKHQLIIQINEKNEKQKQTDLQLKNASIKKIVPEKASLGLDDSKQDKKNENQLEIPATNFKSRKTQNHDPKEQKIQDENLIETQKEIFQNIYNNFIAPYQNHQIKKKTTFENFLQFPKNPIAYNLLSSIQLRFDETWYQENSFYNEDKLQDFEEGDKYFSCSACFKDFFKYEDQGVACDCQPNYFVVCESCFNKKDSRIFILYKTAERKKDDIFRFQIDFKDQKLRKYINNKLQKTEVTKFRFTQFGEIYDQTGKCGEIEKDLQEDAISKLKLLAYLTDIPFEGVPTIYKLALLNQQIETQSYKFSFKINSLGTEPIFFGFAEQKIFTNYNLESQQQQHKNNKSVKIKIDPYNVSRKNIQFMNPYLIFTNGDIYSNFHQQKLKKQKTFTLDVGDILTIVINTANQIITYTKERTKTIFLNEFLVDENKILVPIIGLANYDDKIELLQAYKLEQQMLRKIQMIQFPSFLKTLSLNFKNNREINHEYFSNLKYPILLEQLEIDLRACTNFIHIDKSKLLVNLPKTLKKLKIDIAACPQLEQEQIIYIAQNIPKNLENFYLDISWNDNVNTKTMQVITDNLPPYLISLDLYFIECHQLPFKVIENQLFKKITSIKSLKFVYLNFHCCEQIQDKDYETKDSDYQKIIEFISNYQQNITTDRPEDFNFSLNYAPDLL